MNPSRVAAVALVVALAVVLGACSSDQPLATDGALVPSIPNPATLVPRPTASTAGVAASPRGSAKRSSSTGTAAPYDRETASPSPMELPWESTVYVESVISPSCVRRGGLATITVRTVSQAAIAYHAIYAGTHGGAPPPYGSGYGGNASGFADRQGRWNSTWTVRADAPVGPARADVVVSDGQAWGYDDPPFTVAGPSGRCDS